MISVHWYKDTSFIRYHNVGIQSAESANTKVLPPVCASRVYQHIDTVTHIWNFCSGVFRISKNFFIRLIIISSIILYAINVLPDFSYSAIIPVSSSEVSRVYPYTAIQQYPFCSCQAHIAFFPLIFPLLVLPDMPARLKLPAYEFFHLPVFFYADIMQSPIGGRYELTEAFIHIPVHPGCLWLIQ